MGNDAREIFFEGIMAREHEREEREKAEKEAGRKKRPEVWEYPYEGSEPARELDPEKGEFVPLPEIVGRQPYTRRLAVLYLVTHAHKRREATPRTCGTFHVTDRNFAGWTRISKAALAREFGWSISKVTKLLDDLRRAGEVATFSGGIGTVIKWQSWPGLYRTGGLYSRNFVAAVLAGAVVKDRRPLTDAEQEVIRYAGI